MFGVRQNVTLQRVNNVVVVGLFLTCNLKEWLQLFALSSVDIDVHAHIVRYPNYIAENIVCSFAHVVKGTSISLWFYTAPVWDVKALNIANLYPCRWGTNFIGICGFHNAQ